MLPWISAGNDMQTRLSASVQFAACIVARTRCPVSAAFNVSRMTSGVRISLITSTSGFSRKASMMPCSKLGECVGISRCRMKQRRLVKIYSSGLSSVTIFRAREALISSMSAASVVDLPAPVGPEMMTSPLGASMSLRKSGCRLQPQRSLMLGAQIGIAEVAPQHLRGRHEILRQGASRMLVHIFVRGIEEQLVVVLVEVRTRNEHRTAKVAAGIIETVGRRGRLRAVIVPAVAIEYAIARVEIALSMELGAAALDRKSVV